MRNIYFSLKVLKDIIKKENPSRIAVVVPKKLIPKLKWSILEMEKYAESKIEIIPIPNGEKAKEWNVLKKLLSDFIRLSLDRNSLILALGGGTVTDLVGFAASIYQRGIKYINIPTTLLAQIDSSIGGKTGINFAGYKNQIGSFYNATATIIDIRFLETLSDELFVDGLAEIIKAGLIKDKSILKDMQLCNLGELRKERILKKIISKSLAVKIFCTSKDPLDVGIRQLLNFGHTIGHAVELKYKLSHGSAVLFGMDKELEISEKLGITRPGSREHFNNLLKKIGIFLNKKKLKIEGKDIMRDKKKSGKNIILPLVKEAGSSALVKINLKKYTRLVSK